MQVDFREWLSLLKSEYLQGFIQQGGASVKFVVSDDRQTTDLVKSEVVDAAQNYLTAVVDASTAKVHLLQEVFFQVASQINWDELTERAVRNCMEELGYSTEGTDLSLQSVAAKNGVSASTLRPEVRRSLETILDRTHDLERDFRYAMLWLCLGRVTGNKQDQDTITQWLRGTLRQLKPAKKLLVFERITRYNARAILSSLGSWARTAGYSGLVLLFDVGQLAVSKRQEVEPGTFHYSQAAAMDAYEVIRQLIDSTDELTGFLAVIVAPSSLFDDEKRGVRSYKALYERVWPDVRLKSRPNPLSALAFLEASK